MPSILSSDFQYAMSRTPHRMSHLSILHTTAYKILNGSLWTTLQFTAPHPRHTTSVCINLSPFPSQEAPCGLSPPVSRTSKRAHALGLYTPSTVSLRRFIIHPTWSLLQPVVMQAWTVARDMSGRVPEEAGGIERILSRDFDVYHIGLMLRTTSCTGCLLRVRESMMLRVAALIMS